MKNFILIIICFSNFVYAQYNYNPTKEEKKNNIQLIEYPNLDIGAGFGYLWLFQLNLTISPHEHFYFQPRISSSLLMNEFGIVAGVQTRVNNNSFLRIGAGYSKGGREVIDFQGKTASDLDRWETLYIRIGLLTYSELGTMINPNINIIEGDHNTVFSVNLAFVWIVI